MCIFPPAAGSGISHHGQRGNMVCAILNVLFLNCPDVVIMEDGGGCWSSIAYYKVEPRDHLDASAEQQKRLEKQQQRI